MGTATAASEKSGLTMSTTVRLADYLFARVRDEGVDAVFLVPGGGAMYLVDALGQNHDLRYVPTHHEQAAAIAAEAYSRINGHLGCALVTTGPGATNAITGVTGAWIESVPMLVISGQVKRVDLMGGSGVRQKGPQEVDIVSIVKPITKYAVTVLDPSEIRYHFEKAVYLATTGRRGPVWLDIPLDVQAAQIDASALKSYVPERSDFSDLTADASAVIDLVNAAERPIIVAGHGIRLAEAAEDFRALYEALGIPVVTTWNATDLIPSRHRLSVGKPGTVALRPPNFAIQNSDLILAIGARLDNVVTAYNPAKFGRHAPKVIVDVDPAELGKFPDDMNIARAVCADAQDFIRAMLAQSRASPRRTARPGSTAATIGRRAIRSTMARLSRSPASSATITSPRCSPTRFLRTRSSSPAAPVWRSRSSTLASPTSRDSASSSPPASARWATACRRWSGRA